MTNATTSRGRLVIVSGPSGAGKTTVLKQLYQCAPVPLVPSVSATTRAPRPGEVDGVDYHFLSEEEFAQRRRRGDFLECVQVFGGGVWYGTLDEAVTPGLEQGKWVLLEIDVQGALSVVEHYPDAITIFVRPSSLEELERRLRGRQTESEAAIQRRLEQARNELAQAHRYRFQVMNDDVERAVAELSSILKNVEAERHD
ncbi:MAG: guanylate kinase [Pirellulales bacterium]|nr:guanylate kinase [Pirellulales bacterium]